MLTRETVVEAARNAGVIGAGGAGFPTHAKLSASADVVIVNAAECEPLLHVDITLLEHRIETVLEGLTAAMAAVGAKRALIGIKTKYRPSMETVLRRGLKAAGLSRRAEVRWLPNSYPMGDEHVLVFETTGRIVPPGGIPLAVATVVMNVETLHNLGRALSGQPVITKWVTVGGAVERRFTAEVPVGLSVSALLAEAGAAFGPEWCVIDGGPLMGRVVDAAALVTKTTKGVLVFPAAHPVAQVRSRSLASQARVAEEVCCSCRACTDVCPRYLLGHAIEPHRYMRATSAVAALDAGDALDPDVVAGLSGALLCSECGACEAMGCRMDLSPRFVNKVIKGALQRRGVRYQAPAQPAAPALEVRSSRDMGAISAERLLMRQGLGPYDHEAPLTELRGEVHSVTLGLGPHIGAPAEAAVSSGQVVAVGDVIGEIPQGKLSARVHASTAGVASVKQGSITISS